MKTYTIKPLEWSERRYMTRAWVYCAVYTIEKESTGGCTWKYQTAQYCEKGGHSTTLEGAKQAAEEDWVRRITAALCEVQP